MSRRRWGRLLTALGLVIFVAYLAYTNPFSVLLEAGRFNPWLYMWAVVIDWVGLLFLAGSWHMLLRAMDVRVSLWRTIQVTFVSLFVVFILPIPSGFEIIRAYLVRGEEGGNAGKAVSSVMVSKVYYFIGFSVLLLAAAFMVVVLGGGEIPVRPELVWFVVGYAFLNTLIFGVLLTPRLLSRLYSGSPGWLRSRLLDRVYSPDLGLGGFNAFIQEMDSAVQELRHRPVDNLLSVLMVGLHWSSGAVTTYLVALSLGVPISLWVVILIYGVIEFIQQLNVVVPSGLGVVDAGLTGALTVVGVPLNVAAAISLLTRLATYWLELVICGLVSIRFGYREALGEYLD
ncbi:MAG TPA: lysylphosphatidylglycerol synthase transmembrane domain-containing protein [Candidatus Desulfaltia sp.]|nr:lysylphosphatidylglycerol synthase transmembrane domain-containing protein [Candidatus Desulfaltia sp.]